MKNNKWNLEFKAFLARNEMTAKDVSAKTGIPELTIVSYRSGKRTPSDKNKEKLYKDLGFDIYKALYGETNEN